MLVFLPFLQAQILTSEHKVEKVMPAHILAALQQRDPEHKEAESFIVDNKLKVTIFIILNST